MLGLRHFKQTAIDLWQGEAKDFAADLTILVETWKPKYLEDFAISGKRHMSLIIADRSIEPAALFDQLKNFIDHGGKNNLVGRRISLILASLEAYDAFQEALFRIFPEA